MAFVLAPYRDGRRLMNADIPIDGTEILKKDLLQLTVSCCCDDEGPGYRRALSNNYTNIPRQMRFRCHDNDTISLTLDGHHCKDDKENNQPASFYRDGGRKENKIPPEENIYCTRRYTMAFVLAPYRDGRRLMNADIPIDGTEILKKDLLQLTVSCCCDDEGPGYRRALSNNYTNIPRQMRFRCHDNDTISLTLDGHHCKDDKENNQPASFYRDGGRKENKIPPEENIYCTRRYCTYILATFTVL